MYRTIESRNSWYEILRLDTETAFELKFWFENIEEKNGYTFKPSPITSKIIFTDASDTGYGGFQANRLGKILCSEKFTEVEKSMSYTARELLAVKFVIKSFEKTLTNESVKVHVDNQNAARILSVGSCKKHLHDICLEIFKLCFNRNIKLIVQWVPRENNVLADELSKLNETDNWSIDFRSFCMLNYRYGPFTIDRFSDNRNNKVYRFNSNYNCPGTLGVDTFTQDWSKENNWVCPPIKYICSALIHFKLYKAKGTVIIPMWRSAYFGRQFIQMA